MPYSASRAFHVHRQAALTTDATVTTLKTIPIKAVSVARIWAEVTAVRTGGSAGTAGDAASYVVTATVKNPSGTATIVGAVTVVSASEDQAAWDATITVSGGTALVRVTGAANNNITWNSWINVTENA